MTVQNSGRLLGRLRFPCLAIALSLALSACSQTTQKIAEPEAPKVNSSVASM